TVRKVTLWRRDLDNRPGALAQVLAPLAGAGADLQIAMGYRIPGQESRAVLELAPVSGNRAMDAARESGLGPSDIPTLVVEGDNAAGVGLAQSRALGEAGINVAFLIAQVMGRRFSAVYGFATTEDANRAAALLKRAAPAARKKAAARTTRKPRRHGETEKGRKGKPASKRRR
ncbi:MAG TPA: hypothetical protein VFO85_14440, partial [Vicinamibacteria bacterium]|nr:hypothetical protein [Vicinamibacteria bacterium]